MNQLSQSNRMGTQSKSRLNKFQTRPQASQLHKDTLEVLREMFPHFKIEQEQSVKVSCSGISSVLFFDFIIPEAGLAVECQGKQHFQYVGHFHGDEAGFRKSKKHDEIKKEWCEENSIDLIEIRYDEKVCRKTLDSKIGKIIKEREKCLRT